MMWYFSDVVISSIVINIQTIIYVNNNNEALEKYPDSTNERYILIVLNQLVTALDTIHDN